MCPVLERVKRMEENDIHRLEKKKDGSFDETSLQCMMVKKFQRSSADHELQIAEMLRTPKTLLRTIEYIESSVMYDINATEDKDLPPEEKLFIYLFIWDRYRMVAKDFTLQQSALEVTDVWVECHERMARWFIFMDHEMKHNGKPAFDLH